MPSLINTILHRERRLRIRSQGQIVNIQLLSIIITALVMLCFLSIKNEQEKRVVQKKPQELPKEEVLLPPVQVSAKSFLIYDIRRHKILLSKNDYENLPLASLTKLKTATLFASQNTLQETITIPSLGKGHVYDYTLKEGDSWTAENLIKYMLTISSNDAAEILAQKDTLGRNGFITKMNERSNSSSTAIFTSPSGLDNNDTIGGLGNTHDIVSLIETLYKQFPELLEATTKQKISVSMNKKILNGIPNTNQEVATYRGISGSKTGYTDKAGGNLAILYDEGLGNPIAIVILGSTRTGRFEDMQKLLHFVHTYTNELLEEAK